MRRRANDFMLSSVKAIRTAPFYNSLFSHFDAHANVVCEIKQFKEVTNLRYFRDLALLALARFCTFAAILRYQSRSSFRV